MTTITGHALHWNNPQDEMPPLNEPVLLDLGGAGIAWGAWGGECWELLAPLGCAAPVRAWSLGAPGAVRAVRHRVGG